MKNVLTAVIGALGLGLVVPAAAGPDFQLIEHARKAKLESQERATRKPALLLDHGPRAQTTPWLNKQRVQAQTRPAGGTGTDGRGKPS